MDRYISQEAVFQVVHGIARGIATKDTEAFMAKDMKAFYKVKGAKEILDSVDTNLCYIPATDVQPVDRWIDAQTNPPIATDGETSDYVLVLRADGRQCVCYYVYDDDDGNYWCSEDEKSMYDIDEVTHWQPLPEPPKDGDTE